MSDPVFLSSFIGRKKELREIERLLLQESIRLITLTGPGGCGKTRLANELLSKIKDTFEDGSAWIDLVGVSQSETLSQTVASTLGIRPAPGQTVLSALIAALESRQTLLILDNCEHLKNACAQLVSALLHACPDLYFLATSRQRLGVEGEQVWPVPPLSYPDEATISPESLTDYDAIKLFFARARQIRPDFDITTLDADAAVKITSLLEGMPLAIELAAARVNVLDVMQMADRLTDQLSFLAGQQHSENARHQSLRVAIRWSYDLLSSSEQTLFNRLGVFTGGFSLEAVETICSSEPLSEKIILDLLGQLIDKSLVIRERRGKDGTRYRQLESIRQYAAEKLHHSGEVMLIKERHLDYYSGLCRKAEPHMIGAEQLFWTEKLNSDYENVISALRWAVKHAGESERYRQAALSMVTALYWYWNYAGSHVEARDWFSKILNHPDLSLNPSNRADLLHKLATYTWLLGDYQSAKIQLLRGLDIAQSVDHTFAIGQINLMLGIISLHQDQIKRAIELLHDADVVFRSLNERRGLVITYANLGGAYLRTGDLETARTYAEKAVHFARINRDIWGLGISLSGLSDVRFRQGDFETALAIMEQALEAIERSGQQWLRAEALWRLAEMSRAKGDTDSALKRLESCYELAQETGALEWQLSALDSMAFLSIKQGWVRRSIGNLIEILRLTGGQSYKRITLHAFLGVIQLAANDHQWQQAATLWGAYESLMKTHTLAAFEEESRILNLLRPHLEKQPVSQERKKGSRLGIDRAASLAMEFAQSIEHRVEPEPYTHDLRLFALGPTQVFLKGRLLTPSDWTFAKPKELLYYLAFNSPKTKEQIGLDFWPDATPVQLRTSLRAALYHLRRALGNRDWIKYANGYYEFNHEMSCWFDVEAFEKGIESAGSLIERAPERAMEELQAAVELYRGDFLQDIDEDNWATLRRETLMRKYRLAVNMLGDLLIDREAYDRAIQVYRSLLAVDNLLEEAYRGLMRSYALSGERGLALQQYRKLVEIFREELGVQPSAETTELYNSLRQETS